MRFRTKGFQHEFRCNALRGSAIFHLLKTFNDLFLLIRMETLDDGGNDIAHAGDECDEFTILHCDFLDFRGSLDNEGTAIRRR